MIKLKTLPALLLVWIGTNRPAQSAPLKPFVSEKNDSLYTIGLPGTSLEIDARKAGRISSLKIDGQEFLYLNKAGDNWGSTFWTSPQSAWGWPPLEPVNSKPYAGANKDHVVLLKGMPDPKLGLSVQKEFKFNQKDTSFSILYILVNTSEKPVQAAPWEITRVHPGGVTIFPKGKGVSSGMLAPLVQDSIACTWFKYEASTIPKGVPKLFSDGSEGWLAQVSGNRILIKKFKDIEIAEAAPQEAEIELYANPDHSYIEVEQQGSYVTIPKGAKTSWEVTWYVRTLPAGMQVSVGNGALISYIRKVIH